MAGKRSAAAAAIAVKPRSSNVANFLRPGASRAIAEYLRHRPLTQEDAEGAREDLKELEAAIALLDLASDHANEEISGAAALGLSDILDHARSRIEQRYRWIFERAGVSF